MSSYIPNPKSLEDFAGNVRFQLENAEGYLSMQRIRGDLDAVHIKAGCLVDAARALRAAVEAEMRAAVKAELSKEAK